MRPLKKNDNLLITPMLHSTPNITQPSDGSCEKAPVKAFGDRVVKNTPPYLTFEITCIALLRLCGRFSLLRRVISCAPMSPEGKRPLFLSTNSIATHMKRITMIASLWMLCSVMMYSSCSSGKKGNTPEVNQTTAEASASSDTPAAIQTLSRPRWWLPPMRTITTPTDRR